MHVRTLFFLLFLSGLGAAQTDPEKDRVFEHLRNSYDKNGDGKIGADEYPRGAEKFKALDKDGDGLLTPSDFSSESGRRGARRPGNRRAERPKAPAVCDIAPDFELKTLDQKSKVKLSSFREKTPVVLVFGSYT